MFDNKESIKKAMLFAAGRGERLRPLTDTCPKPLLKIQDKTILDYSLDALEQAGVAEVMINVCHLGHMVVEHLQSRTTPHLHFSVEEELLGNGGSTLKVLDFFGVHPFLAINGDTLWQDKDATALDQVLSAWNSNKMDVLLMLAPKDKAHGYGGRGDYHLLPDGRLRFKALGEEALYIAGGVKILNPSIFQNHIPGTKFSLKAIYDEAEARGGLYGVVYTGEWFEIGTPQSLEATQAWFRQHAR